ASSSCLLLPPFAWRCWTPPTTLRFGRNAGNEKARATRIRLEFATVGQRKQSAPPTLATAKRPQPLTLDVGRSRNKGVTCATLRGDQLTLRVKRRQTTGRRSG